MPAIPEPCKRLWSRNRLNSTDSIVFIPMPGVGSTYLYPDEPDERRPHSRVLDVSLPLDNSQHLPCVAMPATRLILVIPIMQCSSRRKNGNGNVNHREILLLIDRHQPQGLGWIGAAAQLGFHEHSLSRIYNFNYAYIAVSSPARRFIKHLVKSRVFSL